MPTRVKRREYAVALDAAGRLTAEGNSPLELDEPWTPEHLVLAALAVCSVTSLRYHARRANLELTATASASGEVAPREEDGRYAFVEIDCRVEAEIEPQPADDELTALLARAERGCFVGASLTATPRYAWIVNSVNVK
jgi:organic hydroperoxide reductase OsmC/OhrA